ncbi:unnamed protein product [Nyctereutes procyonoides]|uniref:(raccoon dog) hypothetical protein n=1 Tax=Nyctereutes procyonoides TaxID=34880 RepID=A0A811YXI5_NYCPR|nr:unnamed protein product [Nyctereutes procyonoides]
MSVKDHLKKRVCWLEKAGELISTEDFIIPVELAFEKSQRRALLLKTYSVGAVTHILGAPCEGHQAGSQFTSLFPFERKGSDYMPPASNYQPPEGRY